MPDHRGPLRPARRLPLAALTLTAAAAVVASTVGPAAADSTKDRKAGVDQQLQQARQTLEGSSSAVQAAAAALQAVQAQLPAAWAAVAAAQAQLADAQHRDAEARAELARAQAQAAQALDRVHAATDRVEAEKRQVDGFARAAYQQGGPMAKVGLIMSSRGPADFLERSGYVQTVFRAENAQILSMEAARLELQQAGRALDQRRGEAAAAQQATADAVADRARASQAAEQAAQQVDALIARQQSALNAAQAARTTDRAHYDALQAESARLAQLIQQQAAARARTATAPQVHASGKMLWPANGPLTSRFGWRMHPIYGEMRLHAGIDIGAAYGSPVWAAMDGVVIFAGQSSGYGNLVIVDHGTVDGRPVATAYGHMSSIGVRAGQHVSRGQTIAAVGNEGNSTGPHLHFEVRINGQPTDPMAWF